MPDLTKLFDGAHPFVSQPGTWMAAGHGMMGEKLERFAMQGNMTVRHEGERVVTEASLTILTEGHPSFNSRNEWSPTGRAGRLAFRQENDQVGDLTGEVIALGDRIVTRYESSDGLVSGTEILHRMGENRYALTGFVAAGGRITNLWSFDLVRPAANTPNTPKD